MGPFALLAPLYNAGLTQDFQVIAEGGLRQAKRLKQLADALFSPLQDLQYLQAVFISQRL